LLGGENGEGGGRKRGKQGGGSGTWATLKKDLNQRKGEKRLNGEGSRLPRK